MSAVVFFDSSPTEHPAPAVFLSPNHNEKARAEHAWKEAGMSVETLPGFGPITPERIKNGPMMTATRKVVASIESNVVLAGRYAALCALALIMAEDVDNIDPSEKAYARVKLYDSAASVCTQLAEAMGETGDGDALTVTLAAIRSEDTVLADAEGDDL